MDPLTHAISGSVLARALPRRPLPKGQVILLMLLSMAPDADFVLHFISDTTYLHYHRGVTHSALMLPLWTWLFYALFRKTGRSNGLPAWLIAAAIGLHIFLDLITSFGTMVLAPISDWRATLDLVFIIDPLFTACMLLPMLAALIWRRQARALAIGAVLLSCSYIALTAWVHDQALELVRKQQPGATSYAALPLPFSPFHWQLIAAFPDHYRRALADLRPGFAGSAAFFTSSFVTHYMPPLRPAGDLRWQQLPAMASVPGIDHLPGVAFYRWFARFPVLLVRDDKHIEFGDLRFGAGEPGTVAPFMLDIDFKPTPSAWLIWRAGQKSPLH